MTIKTAATITLLGAALFLSSCGRFDSGDSGGGLFRGGENRQASPEEEARAAQAAAREEQGLFDLFGPGVNENTTLEVNRYIWNAALDVLNFMPLESADPFSGIQVYGFGTPPGGRISYRATVVVRDPALDARSLSLSLVTRSSPASAATVQATEDAILTRARQLRIQDGNL